MEIFGGYRLMLTKIGADQLKDGSNKGHIIFWDGNEWKEQDSNPNDGDIIVWDDNNKEFNFGTGGVDVGMSPGQMWLEEGRFFLGGGDKSGTVGLTHSYEVGISSMGFSSNSNGTGSPGGGKDSPYGDSRLIKNNDGNITGFHWAFGSADNDEWAQWKFLGIIA